MLAVVSDSSPIIYLTRLGLLSLLLSVKPLLNLLRDESNFRMSEQLYADALTESGESV